MNRSLSRGLFRIHMLQKHQWIPVFLPLMAVAWLALSQSLPIAAANPPRAMLVDLPDGRLVGLPIHWGRVDAAILQPNGHIQVVDTERIVHHEILSELFHPQSLQQARLDLQRELGERFETLVTGPYVIAAPRGQVSQWDSRFKSLFSGYLRFFQSRGWEIIKPDFPLVVIVLHNKEEFLAWASREVQDVRLGDNLAGMYVTRSNRCLLYQVGDGVGLRNLRATEETIAHEAIHQLAYNTGIHERLFEHPLWFVEGLATMFEIPAVYDSSLNTNDITVKFHPEKVSTIRGSRMSAEDLGHQLHLLIQSDQLFRTQPQQAYALSWALTFYLVEKMPREYYNYIMLQRKRGFQSYSEGDREYDFRHAFGASPQHFSRPVLRLLND